MVHRPWVAAGLVCAVHQLGGTGFSAIFSSPCKVTVCSAPHDSVACSLFWGDAVPCNTWSFQDKHAAGYARVGLLPVHLNQVWSVHATLFRHRIYLPTPELKLAWLLDLGDDPSEKCDAAAVAHGGAEVQAVLRRIQGRRCPPWRYLPSRLCTCFTGPFFTLSNFLV